MWMSAFGVCKAEPQDNWLLPSSIAHYTRGTTQLWHANRRWLSLCSSRLYGRMYDCVEYVWKRYNYFYFLSLFAPIKRHTTYFTSHFVPIVAANQEWCYLHDGREKRNTLEIKLREWATFERFSVKAHNDPSPAQAFVSSCWAASPTPNV